MISADGACAVWRLRTPSVGRGTKGAARVVDGGRRKLRRFIIGSRSIRFHSIAIGRYRVLQTESTKRTDALLHHLEEQDTLITLETLSRRLDDCRCIYDDGSE